ncbi:MAG: hypothetical protein IKU44_03290 [Firmicutes bacterium]|nr:hypothetical protein [Bacillota bacterium]
MSENVVINGELYEGIDAIAVENESGETVLFGDGNTPITGAMMSADYDPDNDKVISIENGGTGASNAIKARENLGLSDVATKNIVPIEMGGTGFSNRKDVLNGLLYLGANLVVESDAPSSWVGYGSCYAYFNTDSEVINKPTGFGMMVQEVVGNIVIQRWYTQSTGAVYYRQGNATGWNSSASVTGKEAWKMLLNEANGVQKSIVWESDDMLNPFVPGDVGKILVNLSSYSEVEIEFKNSTANTGFGNGLGRITVRKNTSGRMSSLMNITSNSPLVICSRQATVRDDGVTFEDGYAKNVVTSESVVDNSYILPFRIYGIRGIK